MTPSISTARMTLRPLTKATGRNVAWLRDPEVVRYSEHRHRTHTLSSQLRYISNFVDRSHLWAMIVVESGEHIGNVSAMHDGPNNVSEVGILIGETSAWGEGYGKEAWHSVCGWLLDKDCGGVRKIEAGCMQNNVPMMKIIKGSRFEQEGERKLHFLFDGNPISMALFGRMR